MKPLFVFICFLLLASQLYAQYPSYSAYNIENGAPSNEIYSLLQDKDGYIWIGSDAGVYRFNGVQYEHFTSDDLNARSATGLIQTKSGKIFGYNFKGQVFYIDSEGLHVLKNWINPVNGLAIDAQGNIWVSSQNGCFYLDEKELKIKTYISKLDPTQQSFASSIRNSENGDIYYQNSSKLIKISHTGAESKWNLSKEFQERPILISNSKTDPWLFSIADNRVYRISKGALIAYYNLELSALLKDRKPTSVVQIDQDLWIHTHTGVVRFQIESEHAELFYPNVAFSGCITDKEGNYWFSTLHHGLLKMPSVSIKAWNRTTGSTPTEQFSHVTISPKGIYSASTTGEILKLRAPDYSSQLIKHDPQADFGMLHYDPMDDALYFNKLSNLYCIEKSGVRLLNEHVRAVKDMLHLPEGYLLLSSQGIYFTQTLTEDLEIKHLIADGWYREICQSPFDKHFYIAGNDGLLQLQQKNKRWKLAKNLFPDKQVLSLCADPQAKRIYFLTFDGEIYTLDQSGNTRLISKALGTYRPYMIRFYKDHLFLSTVKGLVRLSIKTGEISVLDNKKGLTSNNLRHIAIKNDTCWAASGKGVICIPLNEFNREHQRGYIRHRGLLLNDQLVSKSKATILQHNDLLAILIDGISYSSNGEFQLAYRIRGHSSDWIKVPGSLGKLEIPRLPSGNIVIEVKMIDYWGKDSINTLRFSLQVIPPFYQRWWFYVLLALSVGAIVYFIFTLRLRRLRKKQQQILKQVHLENELRLTQQNALKAQMNPHFLFNVLNSIKGYIYENDKKNAARYLSDFSNLVRKVLELSSQSTVSLDKELEALEIYIDLEAMLIQSDFHYTCVVEENVDVSGIKVPALLIQPYIENAFKHGLRHKPGRKELNLHLQFDEQEEILTIEVNDNGIGRTASARINNENSPEHNSFATDAMEKRLELLNHDKKDLVGIEISDKFDSAGEAAGTTVTIRIHV
jgi:ligand-binding sensor domain-containing protein/uncharacterized membrane-anchored protein YhcB (DUF1043 family)